MGIERVLDLLRHDQDRDEALVYLFHGLACLGVIIGNELLTGFLLCCNQNSLLEKKRPKTLITVIYRLLNLVRNIVRRIIVEILLGDMLEVRVGVGILETLCMHRGLRDFWRNVLFSRARVVVACWNSSVLSRFNLGVLTMVIISRTAGRTSIDGKWPAHTSLVLCLSILDN